MKKGRSEGTFICLTDVVSIEATKKTSTYFQKIKEDCNNGRSINIGEAGGFASHRASPTAVGCTQEGFEGAGAFPAAPRPQPPVCCCASRLPPAFAMSAPLAALLALAACSARAGPRMQIRRSTTP